MYVCAPLGYWINNAGINGGRRALSELTMQQVESVVKVNLLGIFHCTKVAMDIMAEQEGFTGHIFNTVGSGVKGGGTPGYATYGVTKRGLPQLTASLVKEIDEGVQGYEKKMTKGTIQVHSLSPGMVFTKLLLDDSTPGKSLLVQIGLVLFTMIILRFISFVTCRTSQVPIWCPCRAAGRGCCRSCSEILGPKDKRRHC